MLRSAWALQISAVSFLPLVAVAQEVGCRPYRVVYVGDLSDEPLGDTPLDEGGDHLFPRGDLRFHLSADRVISGTVMTPCVEGDQTVLVARASLWQPTGSDGSSWERVELDPETEPGAPAPCQRRSAVGGMNDDGVIVGARGWHALHPTDYTPTAWRRLTDGSLQMIRLGTLDQQGAWAQNGRSGMLCAVGGGTMPAVGGWITPVCLTEQEAPCRALLDSDLPEVEQLFCTGGGLGPVERIGRVSAFAESSAAGCSSPLGTLSGGVCELDPGTGLCRPTDEFLFVPTRWACEQDVCSAIFAPNTSEAGWDARLADGNADLGIGFVRRFGMESGTDCNDQTFVFFDPAGIPWVRGLHALLPEDALDRPYSRGASISERTDGQYGFWHAVGARYGNLTGSVDSTQPSQGPRGVVWQSRLGNETIEWCGEHMDALVRGAPDDLTILACTDVLPGGAAVGYGVLGRRSPAVDCAGEPVAWGAPGGKLMLFTAAADLNGDLCVDGADLGRLLTAGGSDSILDLSCSPDGGCGMVDGADYGILLSQWTGSDGVVSINWGCSGSWDDGEILDAAGGAATMLGFDDLNAMADFATSAPPVEALGMTELGALITQSILGDEP